MISIRSNFFYTRSVPCELWFFDRAKPANRKDKVLMLDARNIYRKVTRKIYDFSPEQMRNLRHRWGLIPVYKMVDTCAAEFEAVTPYYYSTYEQENEAQPLAGRKAVVIGSGPIRIGQGIEFDYCSVHAAWALSQAGVRSIMINSNPETVSTDFDTSDRLYFEPLDEEAVRDILENETVDDEAPPSMVQFGVDAAKSDPRPGAGEPLPPVGRPLLAK